MEAAIGRPDATLARKRRKLREEYAAMRRVLVAFSGGRDSVLLLHEALSALGAQNVWVVTASSRIRPKAELEAARQVADAFGVELTTIETHELSMGSFRANGPERCRVCKAHLFGILRRMAGAESIEHVVDGLNSTEREDRDELLLTPAELGIASPLADAGLTRHDVRRIIEAEDLPVPRRKTHCLASRVSAGIPLTGELLERIARAETLIEQRGFTEAIVRLHSDGLARIKVPAGEIGVIFQNGLTAELAKEVSALGFDNVAVDLNGT